MKCKSIFLLFCMFIPIAYNKALAQNLNSSGQVIMSIKTEKIGDSISLGMYDPASLGFWNVWIGNELIIEKRRIIKTIKFTFRNKPYVAFILDGACGSPCYYAHCEIYSRLSSKKVGKFVFEELVCIDAPKKGPYQHDWIRIRLRVDWKKGKIFDPYSKKHYQMNLDSPSGFFPENGLTHNL